MDVCHAGALAVPRHYQSTAVVFFNCIMTRFHGTLLASTC